MSDYRAIETRYAGCHFRSRLEARWAVFFDAVGWRWQYEPEGYWCQWRLRLSNKAFAYLPDFYLPDKNAFVEVKGQMDDFELDRFCNAVASLTDSNSTKTSVADAFLFCGPFDKPDKIGITQESYIWTPTALAMRKGDILASPLFETSRHTIIASDYGSECYERHGGINNARQRLFESYAHIDRVPRKYFDARIEAMSARFEHGRAGAR
jgi:hypothetical protein